MAEFTLDCFMESGNAYKAALMLELAGADWAPRRVAFFSGQTRSPEFRSMNVMGEVPVLTHHTPHGDMVLSQSGAILDYLSRELDRFGHEPVPEEARRSGDAILPRPRRGRL
jgi:glutathione S-transferase